MKKVLFATLALSLVFAFAAIAGDEKGNATCPVMGNPINKAVYTDYKDMRVFFCCEACIKPFHAEPAKYLKIIADNGEEPMKLTEQSVCPVSGEELLGKDYYADVEGKRVYVCCDGCIGKVKAEPKKFMKVIAERGEYIEDAPKMADKAS